MKLSAVIEELVEERGLDRAVLSEIVCQGMAAAYEKKYPDVAFRVSYNKKTDELEISSGRTVVVTPVDEFTQISLRKARVSKPDVELGQELWLPFEGGIGRIEILRAKQVIATQIRSIEAEAIYREFLQRRGSVVTGVIHKCERSGYSIKIDDVLAFLPKSLAIPGDKCTPGFPIRALLKDVLAEPKNDNQLILDRSSSDFVAKLFELEIPEVFEGIVEIKKIVRVPGYKTKVAVFSHDANIDPVGTCVGVGGVRIKPILRELAAEKIDIINWSDSVETLVRDALKPAEIDQVELGNGEALVWLGDDQRSLAIGKMGQNISLASKLAGVGIKLVPGSGEASGQSLSQQGFLNHEEGPDDVFDE